jgi:D-serine deaminase-like pyridoxal phosphate-dependent protein
MFNQDLIGQHGRASALSGPSLILDRPTLLRNIAAMAERCEAARISLRPHAKTHKSAQIANRQLAAGAVGICCATAAEALALGGLGIGNILLTTPLGEPRKIKALAQLAPHMHLSIVVDHVSQIEAWELALSGSDAKIDALVDVDIGMGRTGARGNAVVHLARRLRESKNLRYAGVQAYSGIVQHIASFAERKAVYLDQLQHLQHVIAALRQSGLTPTTVSGGGTGTAEIDRSLGLFTEIQPGSYVFMDVEYEAVALNGDAVNPYKPALFIRAAVISANVVGQVTVNAGFKALSTDGPLPTIWGKQPEWRYDFFGDEYGRISGHSQEDLRLGDPVDLLVPHCDPTVNLHDSYHVLEDDTLVDIWPIDARGSI